jgi:hypothetical protein
VKTEDFYVCCGYSDNWRVWFSETVIITVLKSVIRKRLVKTEYFYVCCGYSNNWSVYGVKIGYQETSSEDKRLLCELWLQ